MNDKRLHVVVFHGPDNAAKFELLAWLRGPQVGVDARTVGELTSNSQDNIDSRVNKVISWADRAIALVTPDDRSPSGAPNVIDEIGRWRSLKPHKHLAILRHKNCEDIWSNLEGVVRIEFVNRVNESFVKLLDFMGMIKLPNVTIELETADSIQEVLKSWIMTSLDAPNLYIVVGGCEKYDPERSELGMKEYQSTEPVTGIVNLALVLNRGGNLSLFTVCDYDMNFRQKLRGNELVDLIVVGAGDTNRVSKEIFTQGITNLPLRFEPPTSSETIVTREGELSWSRPDEGLVMTLKSPLYNVRYTLICAGNGAAGTNAALEVVADWITKLRKGSDQIPAFDACVVRRYGHIVKIEWTTKNSLS